MPAVRGWIAAALAATSISAWPPPLAAAPTGPAGAPRDAQPRPPAPSSPPRGQTRPAPGSPAGRAQSGPAGSGQAAAALRQEQEELRKLLDALAEHSEKYRLAQLRFVCEETLIRSEFDASSGRRRKEEVDKNDYLLSRTQDGKVVETRRPLTGARDATWKERSSGLPEPFLWALLFTPRSQRLFNYRLAGQEVVHFQLATVIEFNALLPFVDGSEITQWSGRAYVDAHSLDLLRVEAEPSGQEIRIEAQEQAYRQAFKIGGVPLRRRPKAHLHEVDFTYEHEGLRLPGLAITRRYVATGSGEPALQSQVMQIFSDYHLFNVETTDQQLKTVGGPPSPASASPPKP